MRTTEREENVVFRIRLCVNGKEYILSSTNDSSALVSKYIALLVKVAPWSKLAKHEARFARVMRARVTMTQACPA